MPASVERTVEQRILEASAALPDFGGVTGWAALRWQGASWFDGIGAAGLERPVTLATSGSRTRPQAGIALSHEGLDPHHLIEVDHLRLTTAVRSVWFEMRHAPNQTQASIALSMAAYADLVSVQELLDFALEHPAWTGAPQCRRAAALAYENAWSPPEVILALTWEVEAGLGRPWLNRPVFDDHGRHIGTPDLFDPETGLAIEYDGKHHLQLNQRAQDLGREERFRRHGLENLTVLAPHLADRHALARRMHEARARARGQPESRRRWSVEQPSWWTPTHTVALRRALAPRDRARLLGYRWADRDSQSPLGPNSVREWTQR